MKFVIKKANVNEYIAMTPSRHWVTSLEKATGFTAQEKAHNYMNNAKAFFESFETEIVEVGDDLGPFVPLSLDEAEVTFQKLRDAATLLADSVDNIGGLLATLYEELKKCDGMQQDLLHKIEFDDVRGLDGLHLVKQLKEVRIKRREIKDRVSFCEKLTGNGAVNLGTKVKQFDDFGKERAYTPRVLTELFN